MLTRFPIHPMSLRTHKRTTVTKMGLRPDQTSKEQWHDWRQCSHVHREGDAQQVAMSNRDQPFRAQIWSQINLGTFLILFYALLMFLRMHNFLTEVESVWSSSALDAWGQTVCISIGWFCVHSNYSSKQMIFSFNDIDESWWIQILKGWQILRIIEIHRKS